MPKTKPQPLVDVKSLDSFLEDQMTVSSALAASNHLATDKPFRDRTEAGAAAETIKNLKLVKRDAEERRLDTTAIWRATTDAVNVQYGELLSPIDAAIVALERKGLDFLKEEKAAEEEKQRQEQEEIDRRAEEAAAKAQEAAEEAARAKDEESRRKAQEARQAAAAAAVATPVPPRDPPKRLRGAVASLSPKITWHFEVTDVGELAEELTEVVARETAIKALVDAESKASKAEKRDFNLEIPGVRIYSKESGISR